MSEKEKMHFKLIVQEAHSLSGMDSIVSRTRAGKSISYKTVFAGTPVGSWCVEAVCIDIAVVVFSQALILIYRSNGKKCEKREHDGAGDSSRLCFAFITCFYYEMLLTYTFDAITHPAVSTSTFKAPRHIDAGSMHVTVVSPNFTLINVWKDTKTMKNIGGNISGIQRESFHE